MKILGIYRAKRYSPQKTDSDKRILDAVLARYNKRGEETSVVAEEDFIQLDVLPQADLYISMARSEEALRMLDEVANRCLNAPDGIRSCNHRSWLSPCKQEQGEHHFPVWIKRADGCAEQKDDVTPCRSKEELDAAVSSFKKRGIERWVVQQHYEGDLVKCYGVAGMDFFFYSYPADTGQTKFGLEEVNGKAHHYPFSLKALAEAFNDIAQRLKVRIYGGDAVIGESGDIHIIDFNDWPSFAPCLEKAAFQISNLTKVNC